jgi:hypothetical protein
MKSLAIVLALLATPSFAQSDCIPYEDVPPMMEEGGLRLAVTATIDTEIGQIPIELWRDNSGEWVMFVLPPNGTACFIVGGKSLNLIGVGL